MLRMRQRVIIPQLNEWHVGCITMSKNHRPSCHPMSRVVV